MGQLTVSTIKLTFSLYGSACASGGDAVISCTDMI